MSVFDGRHRWGPPVRNGSRITRVCQACGRTDTAETLVPDNVVDAIVDQLRRPNPYRAMFR